MKKSLIVLMLTLFSLGLSQANAQVNEEYKEVLTTYLTHSGSLGSFSQVIDQMTAMMGGQLNEEQKEEIKERSYDALIDLMVPLYEKEISLEDMKAFNQFFLTPAGKRIAIAQPKMMSASMAVGQQWAGQLQKIIQGVMVRE